MTQERYTATNPITGALIKSRPPSDKYECSIEVIQQNNVNNSVYTCEDCATIPCVFPERGTRCSFFEPKATGGLLQRDFSDSHPVPEYIKNAPELTEDQMIQFEEVLQELHEIDCEIFLPSELLKSE